VSAARSASRASLRRRFLDARRPSSSASVRPLAPRASPAMSITHTPRTTALRRRCRSEEQRREKIDDDRAYPGPLLEASISIPLCSPASGLAGIEAPEKGSAGRRKWKAAEELWQKMQRALPVGRRRNALYNSARIRFPPFQGGVAEAPGGFGALSPTPPPAAAPLSTRRG